MNTKIDPTKALNINTPQIISTMAIVTIKCSCVKKEIIMGQVAIPLQCPSCKKTWFVSASVKMEIREMIVDLNKLADEVDKLADNLITQ